MTSDEAVTPDLHRSVARQFASGVTVAAAAHGGRSHAITATAFCSLSLEPPLVLLSVRRLSRLIELVRHARCFGVSILGSHQRHVGEWAATGGRPIERELPGNAGATAVTGAPLVPDALAWFDCRLQSESDHGDHVVLVGLVVAAGSADRHDPLIYFRGQYHDLGPRSRLMAPEQL